LNICTGQTFDPQPVLGYDPRMGFTIFVWLAFLCGIGYAFHRCGRDGGNAIWIAGLIFITVGNFIAFFFSAPG
jgi:uncharacterized membrane protein